MSCEFTFADNTLESPILRFLTNLADRYLTEYLATLININSFLVARTLGADTRGIKLFTTR